MTKSANNLKTELENIGALPVKRLGQNFLMDERVIAGTVDAAQTKPRENVLEVGGGTGILTEELARRGARVVTVEKDARLMPFLEKIASYYPSVTAVQADILGINPQIYFGKEPYKLVGNPPYYLTGRLLRHFLEEALEKPARITLIVQEEVARKVAARPPDMGLLSLGVQLFGKPEVIRAISKSSFWPQPEVDSALLVIEVYAETLLTPEETKRFFVIARAAFMHGRKQIQKSLGDGLGLPQDKVLSWLASAGIEPKRRPETLTVEEWIGLVRKQD